MAIPNYATALRPGVEGAIANEEPARFISRSVETVGGVGFGKAVIQGTAEGQCKVPAAAGKVLGIVVRERSVDPSWVTGNGFAQYRSARIMTQGCIWVKVGSPVVAGDPVSVTADANSTFSNTGGLVITNARFDTAAGAGGMAIVRLDALHG